MVNVTKRNYAKQLMKRVANWNTIRLCGFRCGAVKEKLLSKRFKGKHTFTRCITSALDFNTKKRDYSTYFSEFGALRDES